MSEFVEETMRVDWIDLVDNDHGGSALQIELRSEGTGQAAIFSPTPQNCYAILSLFQVDRLQRAVGKPSVVLRKEPYGYIEGLKRLSCDPEMVVLR